MRFTYNNKNYELIEFVEPDTQKKHDIIGIFEVADNDTEPDKYNFVDYFYFGGNYDKSYLVDEATEILRRRETLDLEDYVTCAWCNETVPMSDCRHEVRLGYVCSHCEEAIRSRGEDLLFDD